MRAVSLVLLLVLAGTASADYLISEPESLLTNGCDYLVVTHDTFTDAVYPLCELRDSLGLEVKMAEVSLVYSTFDSGPRTRRIRSFMERVYHHWQPRPEFILLVGDACKDTTLGDFVPSRRFPKFSYGYARGLTEHGADCWYVTHAGNDSVPDMIIGRLPVNRPAQAESVVAKVVRYETTPDTAVWTRTVLYIASTDRQPYGDAIVRDYLEPGGDSVWKVYETMGSSDSLRSRSRNGFNAGAALLLHCTHGGFPPLWYGSRTLFHYTDVPLLANFDRLPVVIGRG